MLMMKFQFHSNRNDLEDCCKQTMGNLEKLKAKFGIDLQFDSLRNKVSLISEAVVNRFSLVGKRRK